jgi:Transposase IS4
MMSTVHDPTIEPLLLLDPVRRPRASLKNAVINTISTDPQACEKRALRKLAVQDDYNRHIGGSDSHTQQNSYYSTANHRHLRVWWPLFYFILNAAITNSYVLYKEHIQKAQKRVKMLSHAEFQEKIALDLLSQPEAVLRRRQLAHSTRRSAPHLNRVQRGPSIRHE